MLDQPVVASVQRVIEGVGHVILVNPSARKWPQEIFETIYLRDLPHPIVCIELGYGEPFAIEVPKSRSERISKETVDSGK